MMEKSSVDLTAQDETRIRDNIRRVRERIAAACVRAGRSPEEITLMGVTKTVSPAHINAAIAEGITHIGENRVQEYLGKRDELKLDGVKTALIGHLQTNKVKAIVGTVDSIDSVDSLRLAQAISTASERLGRVTDVLVEVNIGGEEAKSGVEPELLEPLLEQIRTLSGIRVRGLMTIPPISQEESKKRWYFSRMCKLFIDIRGKNIDNIYMDVLSMGMSSDFEEAILEGATQIRVGSALFGQRI